MKSQINNIIDGTCKFGLGDEVYHSTNPECPRGIVIDIHYSYRKKELRYIVSFGIYPDQESSLLESELTLDKVIL